MQTPYLVEPVTGFPKSTRSVCAPRCHFHRSESLLTMAFLLSVIDERPGVLVQVTGKGAHGKVVGAFVGMLVGVLVGVFVAVLVGVFVAVFVGVLADV